MTSRAPLFGLIFVAGVAAAAVSAVGCSDDDTTGTPDSGGGNDAAPEASPCGPLTLVCKPGTPGKACSQVPTNAKCNGTAWECQAGSISASQCGCAADNNRPVGADCTTDAGGGDDAAADAADAGGDTGASDGGSGG